MVKGLQAGFGRSIAHELPGLKALGVQLVRLDCKGLDATTTAALFQEPLAVGLIPFPVVSSIQQLTKLPAGAHVELLNEPDIFGPSASAYAGLVSIFDEECARRSITLHAGAISNLNDRGFRFLREAKAGSWPARVHASIHWYPHGDWPETPHPGYRSRNHEIEVLLGIIGSRPWGVTEWGFHTAPRKGAWWDWRKKAWTDQQVAEFVGGPWGWSYWDAVGAGGAVLYQHVDGPNPNDPDHRYGIMRQDRTWKPVAATFKAAA